MKAKELTVEDFPILFMHTRRILKYEYQYEEIKSFLKTDDLDLIKERLFDEYIAPMIYGIGKNKEGDLYICTDEDCLKWVQIKKC